MPTDLSVSLPLKAWRIMRGEKDLDSNRIVLVLKQITIINRTINEN